MKRLLAFLLAIVSAFGCCMAVGCGGDGLTDEQKKNALIIECHNAGYGKEWMVYMSQEFAKVSGKEVIVTYQTGIKGASAMNGNIETKTSETDLFFIQGPNWQNVYKGQIKTPDGKTYPCLYENLNDLYDSQIGYGETQTVKDKMNDYNVEELYFEDDKITNLQGYYHFPYVGGMQGFVVNKGVFNTKVAALKAAGYGDFQMPRTTNELLELCAALVKLEGVNAGNYENSTFAPFIYCADDEYWTSMLTTFVSQYEGVESMEAMYAGYEWDYENNERGDRYTEFMTDRDGVREALKFFEELLKPANHYQHPGSVSLNFTMTQSLFLSGAAMFNNNGDWLEQEMIKNYQNANIEMMKLPVLSAVTEKLSFKNDADKEAKLRQAIDYIDTVIGYSSANVAKPSFLTDDDVAFLTESRSFERCGGANCAVIPSYANNKDLAKEFLRFMVSNQGLKIFEENATGCRPPFDYSEVESNYTPSTFRQSVNKVTSVSISGSSKSKDRIWALGGFTPDLWNQKTRFVVAFTSGGMTAVKYFENENKAIKDNMTTAKINAGVA